MTERLSAPSQVTLALLATFAAALLASLPMPAHAQNFENIDRLDSLVAMSVGANRGQPGGQIAPIDRRLRLAACPQAPVVEATQPSYTTVSCAAIGWRIRVPLAPGQQAPMAANMPVSRAFSTQSQAVVVKKGDPVQLIAGNETFSISRLMIADEDGGVGAMIRVREDKKAAPVLARVEALGIVRVPGI